MKIYCNNREVMNNNNYNKKLTKIKFLSKLEILLWKLFSKSFILKTISRKSFLYNEIQTKTTVNDSDIGRYIYMI